MDRLRVMYVDDEPINLELFKLNFQRDYDITLFGSPREALQSFAPAGYDVVVSDLRMPGMNGVELISEIKQSNPAMPCIILTAYMDPDAMLQAINKQLVFRYVIKPWERANLKSIIEAAFSTGNS